jgi:hypothetical protein
LVSSLVNEGLKMPHLMSRQCKRGAMPVPGFHPTVRADISWLADCHRRSLG